MLKEKTNRWFLALGAALLCAGLGAAALWDLEIDLALYSPGFLPAVLMEAFGWFPQYLPAVVLCVCIALDGARSMPLRAAGGGFEGAFAQFTSWMQPFGNGGSSFPSGHTAAACSVFILTLACDVCLKWNRRRTLVWALCWAYVAFMALCRLVIGRHYLSDTLAAAFVMLLLYLGMRKTKWYRAGARELTAPGT